MSTALTSEAPVSVLLNMQDLALKLGVSRQTLSLWVKKWPDFPVEQRGTHGTEYLFDTLAVFAFLQAKKDEQLRSRADRDEKLAQLVLPLGLKDGAEAADGRVSVKDQIEAFRLRRLQREEMERCGQLVLVADMGMKLSDALVKWNSALHGALRAAGREHNLPDSVMRALETRLADTQRSFVRDLADLDLEQRASA